MVVLKWKDKRDVYAISSTHKLELKQTTNRHGTELVKPNVIIDYNVNMSETDLSDPMLSYNSSLKKTLK